MLDQQTLKSLLKYDPETGEFIWLVSSKRAKAGDVAGCWTSNGYRGIKIDNVRHLAHRLAWLYMTGEWPRQMIDHIDRDTGNNRFANLRDVDAKTNANNAKRNIRSGGGVYRDRNRFRVMRWRDGRFVHFGCFETRAEADAVAATVA